jgi:serine/threonine-protein kinase
LLKTLRASVVPLALAGLLQSSPVLADTASDADALFNEARKLSGKGDHAGACSKFEESRRLLNGLGVTMYLADCMQKIGRPTRALELFREAQQMAKERRDKREKLAHERIEALEKSVPKLQIKIEEPTGDLEVFLGERRLEPAELEQPIRLDPGNYTVIAKAPGKGDFSGEVELSSGQTATLEIPALGASAQSSGGSTATSSGAVTPEQDAPQPDTAGMGSRRTLALALGAAGVVGVGLGTVFGLQAKSKLDESNEGHCDANDACDSTGLDLRSDAQSAALLSTISFGAGVALLGAGAFFWFTGQESSPTAIRIAPEFAPGHAGFRLQKRF